MNFEHLTTSFFNASKINIFPLFPLEYGLGYAWDKSRHTVSVGDFVTWTWQTSPHVADIGYAVHQTQMVHDLFTMDGGFTSGEKTHTGNDGHT